MTRSTSLLRMGIARQDGRGRIAALPAERAVAQLDRTWENCFRYEEPEPDRPNSLR